VTYNKRLHKMGAPLFSFPSPFLTCGTTSVAERQRRESEPQTPYTQQWNMTIEQQLASVGLRISYVGSRTIDLVLPS